MASPDTLRSDDGTAFYAFRFPDAYGDDWRNMRFRSPRAVRLTGAGFAFATRGFTQWTTGDPDLVVRVWPMGTDSLPVAASVLLSDTTGFAAFSAAIFHLDSTWRNVPANFAWVDLSGHDVELDSGEWFHIGYSAVLSGPEDSLAILADDGVPASSYASEWYNGRFVPMSAGWPAVNFLIRAVVESASGVQVLEPVARAGGFHLGTVWPNPFNARCEISFEVTHVERIRVSVLDLLGRERAVVAEHVYSTGLHRVPWDARGFPSGAYFVRMQGETNAAQVARVVLEK